MLAFIEVLLVIYYIKVLSIISLYVLIDILDIKKNLCLRENSLIYFN